MSDENIIEASELDLEYLATIPKVEGFTPFACYELVQSGYPYPDHGDMIRRIDGGTDEKGHLLPPTENVMWVKRSEAESQLAALKLENEKLVELVGRVSSHAICHLPTCGNGDCTCGLTALRAEIERVKGGR